jgi:hypothetical protein
LPTRNVVREDDGNLVYKVREHESGLADRIGTIAEVRDLPDGQNFDVKVRLQLDGVEWWLPSHRVGLSDPARPAAGGRAAAAHEVTQNESEAELQAVANALPDMVRLGEAPIDLAKLRTDLPRVNDPLLEAMEHMVSLMPESDHKREAISLISAERERRGHGTGL